MGGTEDRGAADLDTGNQQKGASILTESQLARNQLLWGRGPGLMGDSRAGRRGRSRYRKAELGEHDPRGSSSTVRLIVSSGRPTASRCISPGCVPRSLSTVPAGASIELCLTSHPPLVAPRCFEYPQNCGLCREPTHWIGAKRVADLVIGRRRRGIPSFAASGF